jgi:hypothetical protein
MGGNSFDLNSHAGVMALLLSVRHSTLPSDEKAELRDLVFLYSSGGGDATVRRALEQKIATHNLQPVDPRAVRPTGDRGVGPAAVAETPTGPVAPPPLTPPRPYGSTRPVPLFSPTSLSSAAAEPAVPPDIHTPPPAPIPSVEPTPRVPDQPITPIVPPEVAAPNTVTEPAPVPLAEAVVAVPVVPASTPPSEPIPAASLPGTFDSKEALERIRTIKATVNQKVGNPVNLVDIDNDLGREYMMALLDAMKKVSGGMPGDLEDAMARLERAFSAVEVRLATEGNIPALGGGAAHDNSVKDTLNSEAVVSVPPAPIVSEAFEPPPTTVPPVAASSSPFVAHEPAVPPTPPQYGAPEPNSVPVMPPPPPSPAGGAYRAASLADDTTVLRTPNDLPDPASLDTSSVAGDPLFTKEVDAGLDQLLSEWILFKKSGLFATGPKGREHPLFKTLAPLTIPIIIAGRYSGASNEIRQSITDYMNGWRYEQGIVYDADETFEHYLRRVIHHIIDLQKRRARA